MGPPIGPRSVRPGIAPDDGERRPPDRPPFEQLPGERFARRLTEVDPRAEVEPRAQVEALPDAAPPAAPVNPEPAFRPVREPAQPFPRDSTSAPVRQSQPAQAIRLPGDPPEIRVPGPVPVRAAASPETHDGRPVPNREAAPSGDMERGASTAPQLRRFIKSRAYVPMHELRRRFGINGNDDDVTSIEVERGRIYVGLPDPEGRLLGELLRAGDIGYELSMDPMTPIVVGVYPMRPVPRP
jgi:hypothetical protein